MTNKDWLINVHERNARVRFMELIDQDTAARALGVTSIYVLPECNDMVGYLDGKIVMSENLHENFLQWGGHEYHPDNN